MTHVSTDTQTLYIIVKDKTTNKEYRVRVGLNMSLIADNCEVRFE